MLKNGIKNKKMRTGRSLNLILWFTFSVFALSIILIYGVVQNILVHKRYYNQIAENLNVAGNEIVNTIANHDGSAPLSKQIYGIANKHGLQLYVLSEDGASKFPDHTEQDAYPEKTELLKKKLEGCEYKIFSEKSVIAYGDTVMIEGEPYYLYISTPADWMNDSVGNLRLVSILTGLIAVVLAFVASGFVAVLITKPVSEVTERAKELARGNYSLRFRQDYYCAEICELSDALEYARTEISKADQMQKELIANVSHDFKTPLTMIKAYASMIREISGEDRQKRDAHAQIIIDESDRLATLIGDLLDLSKIRAELTPDTGSVFNLSDEVYRIASRFDYLKETNGYHIETEVEDDIYTFASRGRIEQVLYNLIGNAVNYTGEDKLVRIRLFNIKNGSRFEVIDTGKGIPPDEIDSIWDRYYRSGKSHQRPVQGSGLGLSIVKNILTVQGCPFGIESEEGKGSCFWVEFSVPEQTEESDHQEKTEKKKKTKHKS